jgi:hypothetical protein
MRPRLTISYGVIELTIYNVITTVIKEYVDSFTTRDLHHLSLVNRDFSIMIPETVRWLQIDFSSLRNPRLNYESQTGICPQRVDMCQRQ